MYKSCAFVCTYSWVYPSIFYMRDAFINQDHNSEFSLKLSNYTNCLEVIPSRAQLEATVLIRVIDSSCFDYEKTTAMTFAVGVGIILAFFFPLLVYIG